jgi:hypothetical protein
VRLQWTPSARAAPQSSGRSTASYALSALGSFAKSAAIGVAGGIVLSMALASGTLVGGFVAAAMIGYGAYSGAMALNDMINGKSTGERVDAAAGLAGGLVSGGVTGWGYRRGYEFTGEHWRIAPWATGRPTRMASINQTVYDPAWFK